MPFSRLTLIPAPTGEEAQQLATGLTDLIAGILRKKHPLTAVLVESPPAHRWTVGDAGQSSAAELEVSITQGTNTEEEKRQFIAEAMALLRRHRPELNAATYIVLRELPASDWGYDGRTQADRAAQAQQL